MWAFCVLPGPCGARSFQAFPGALWGLVGGLVHIIILLWGLFALWQNRQFRPLKIVQLFLKKDLQFTHGRVTISP